MATGMQFGAPMDDEPAKHANDEPNGEPLEALDPNDPQLTSEPLDANTEADAYATPTPPPDRLWRAKLKLEEIETEDKQKRDWWVKRTKKDEKQYYYCLISAQLHDPSGKYDGVTVFPQFGGAVGTNARRDGSVQAITLLAKLLQPNGQPYIEHRPGTVPGAVVKAGQKLTQKGWIELLVKALKTEPDCGIETVWEWSCEGCGKESKEKGTGYARSLLGMHKFPVDSRDRNQRSPEKMCEVNKAHGESRARAKILRFLAVSELPKNA